MSNTNKHFMSLDDGPIIKVALNEWPGRRGAGYVFRTEAEFKDQETNKSTPVVADDATPTMENTKAEIIVWLEANDYEVDPKDNKAALLAAIQ